MQHRIAVKARVRYGVYWMWLFFFFSLAQHTIFSMSKYIFTFRLCAYHSQMEVRDVQTDLSLVLFAWLISISPEHLFIFTNAIASQLRKNWKLHSALAWGSAFRFFYVCTAAVSASVVFRPKPNSDSNLRNETPTLRRWKRFRRTFFYCSVVKL